jgi:hypothetical protein
VRIEQDLTEPLQVLLVGGVRDVEVLRRAPIALERDGDAADDDEVDLGPREPAEERFQPQLREARL